MALTTFLVDPVNNCIITNYDIPEENSLRFLISSSFLRKVLHCVTGTPHSAHIALLLCISLYRSWNNYVRWMSFYILMNLWYGRIASWDIRVLWYLIRIWPSVTDMQHYYHARYPTDDWHIAYMFSLVYFSVEVCLEGVFPHSVSTRQDSCVRGYAPPHAGSPLTKKTKIEPELHLNQARRHLNWRMGLPALLGGNLGCRIF